MEKSIYILATPPSLYSNRNQTAYLDSNYHKKLRKSPFYKSLMIRNGKIFQKIIELAKKA